MRGGFCSPLFLLLADKKKMKKIVVIIASLISAVSMAQPLSTPSIIGDNMLLRRNSEAKIWGWDKAGSKVAIVASWNPTDTLRVTCSSNSRFEAHVATPEAGGPYSLEIIGAQERKTISNVMIGEVWLCSGQSNMQMSQVSTWGTKLDCKEYLAEVDNPNIRTFLVPLTASEYPQSDCNGEWRECHGDMLYNVSLAAYFFAEKMQAELGIPVGIVMSAWGGTNAEVWIPQRGAEANDAVEKSASFMDARTWKPIETSSLYNAMIAPLVPFDFSGALWYQGEANIPCYEYYDSSMRELIDCWREDFGEQLPFYFAQIAPYVYQGSSEGKSAYLREQQALTSQYDNCAMITVNDIVHDVKNIHPKDKRSVGYRFADVALQRTYHLEGYDSYYPEVESFEVKGSKIIAKIINCGGGVVAVEGENSGFQIAAENGEFVEAEVKIKGDEVTLSAKGVKSPSAFRYLFDDSSTCTVKGVNGLPLLPYRSDF